MTTTLAFAECACGNASEAHHWSPWGGHGACSRCDCLAFTVPWPARASDGQLCLEDGPK